MRRIVTWTIVVLLLSLQLNGQSLQSSYSTDPVTFGRGADAASVMVWGDYGIESNAVRQAFLNKFVFGGYLDEELKDRTNGNLANRNQIFSEFDAGMAYFSKGDTSSGKWRWYVQLRNQQFTSLRFPRQLFQLVFYGNGSEKTEQGDFSNAHGYYLSGNRLDAGIHRQYEHWGYAVDIGAVQVNSAWDLDWPEGRISTADDGFEIAFDNEFHLAISDTSQFGLLSMEGWGLAGGVQLYIEMGGIEWLLKAEDLGYVWMNDDALSVKLDTAFTYRGRDIAKLVSGEVNLFPSGDADSLLTLVGASLATGGFTKPYPARFSLAASKDLGNWTAVVGANYRLFSYRMPLIFARAGYHRKTVTYAAMLGYGGAGGLKVGLQLGKTFSDKADLHLGFNHVNAMIAPGVFSGFSAFGMLRYRLP